mmetsp:Transcript_37387/g.117592  ORF Transcript_37387/g.117592 Transcript_37387/m.117592 type:complete len:505 (-) Transcript_37387:123-1637(-)
MPRPMPAVGRRESGAAAFARPVVRELVERPRSVPRSNTGERSPQPSVGSGAASHSGTAVSNLPRRSPKEMAQELLNAVSSGGSRSSKSGATHGAGGGGGGESSGSGGGCGDGCSAASTSSAGVAEGVSAALDSLSPRFSSRRDSQRLEPIESSPHSTLSKGSSSLFRRRSPPSEPGGKGGGKGEAVEARVLPSAAAATGATAVGEPAGGAAGDAASGAAEDAEIAAAVAAGEVALSAVETCLPSPSSQAASQKSHAPSHKSDVSQVDVSSQISWARLANQETQSRPSSPRDSRAPAQGGAAESGTELRSLSRHSASSVDSCEWEGKSPAGTSAAAAAADGRSSASLADGRPPQIDGVRLSGYLWKKGSSWLSFSYHRRLFYLRHNELCFVPPPPSTAPSAAPDGGALEVSRTEAERRIPLGSILNVRVHSKVKFEFELVCASRSYRLRAPSAQALAVWVTTISATWMDVLHREAGASGDFAAGEVSLQAGSDADISLQARDLLS